MNFKTTIAPLTFAVLAFGLAYTQPGISCVATLVVKIATHISL